MSEIVYTFSVIKSIAKIIFKEARATRPRKIPLFPAGRKPETRTASRRRQPPDLYKCGGSTPPFFTGGGFIAAFARCCFCIAINLLVFTSPMTSPLVLLSYCVNGVLASQQSNQYD